MDSLIQFFDPSFDEYQVQYYDLSLRANLKGFSFCVTDSRTSRFLAFKSMEPGSALQKRKWAEKLIERISKEELLLSPFRKVKWMFESPWVCLVPNTLFLPEKAETYFNFNLPGLSGLKIFYRTVGGTDVTCVFGIPESIVDFSVKVFQFPVFYHQSIPFIETSLMQTGIASGQKVYITMYADFLDLLVLEKEKLLLYNTFPFTTASDALYFVMLAFDRLNLDREKAVVSLSGQVQKKSEFTELLRKYVKNIHFSHFSTVVPPHFPLKDNETMKHQQLFNLFQCE